MVRFVNEKISRATRTYSAILSFTNKMENVNEQLNNIYSVVLKNIENESC